jgi:polyhydroxybutyrate depolymerase
MLRLLLLVLLAIPSLASAQENRLKSNRTTHDGDVRRYLSYAPRAANFGAAPRPLIVVLHGGGGTARQISRGTKRRFDQLADQLGFYVVYPNAIGKMWDTGGGFISQNLSPRRDDLGFIERVIDETSAQHSIDRSRVFATGISRGGHASFMMACRSSKVRAIGVVAMNLPVHLTEACRRARAKGLVLINGTDDPIVPYGGGRIIALGKPRDFVHPVEETLSVFGKRNGCGRAPAPRRIDRANDGTVVDQQTWRCRGAPMSLLKVVGGGHTWPSERSILPERVVGRVSRDIVATDEIVRFFLSIK